MLLLRLFLSKKLAHIDSFLLHLGGTQPALMPLKLVSVYLKSFNVQEILGITITIKILVLLPHVFLQIPKGMVENKCV